MPSRISETADLFRLGATGESYPTKQGAKAGIEAVTRAASSATIEDDTD